MKRVIDGKIYDTETATLIDEAAASCSLSDFGYWEESLYRTPRGRYFIAGSGGPMSRWARQIEMNTWSGGAGIEPLSESEALHWCEERGIDAETIGEHFKLELA